MTAKQQRVLDFIAQHIEGKGYAPTLHEIAARFETYVSNAWRYVNVLEAAGRVTFEWTSRGHRRARTMRVKGM